MICEQVGDVTKMSGSILAAAEPAFVVLTHIDIGTKYITELQPESAPDNKHRAELLSVFLFIEAAADSRREQSTEGVYPHYLVGRIEIGSHA